MEIQALRGTIQELEAKLVEVRSHGNGGAWPSSCFVVCPDRNAGSLKGKELDRESVYGSVHSSPLLSHRI